jgi:hypothetical protein
LKLNIIVKVDIVFQEDSSWKNQDSFDWHM